MQQVQGRQPKRSIRVRLIVFIIALLILIAGAIFLALQSLNSLPALIVTIFGALATIFTFLQLWPIFFQKPPGPVAAAPPVPVPQPINIHFHNPGGTASTMLPVITTETQPVSTLPDPPAPAIARDDLTLHALPLPTDPSSIQQRQIAVDEIYSLLVAPDTAAVVLTGIGGIGKSTLASLVFNHAERERRAGRGPFQSEAILLRINDNTTFLELATNLFAATNRSMPNLANLPPQNQAFAVFNALNTTDQPRLIVLDQFESMLDQHSGRALPTQAGVGEFLDALNSQSCTSGLLLTSRPHPHGTRNDAPASLRIYPVGGLDEQEGAALLKSQGVAGTEQELYEAVRRCKGHTLSLRLLNTLLRTYGISLTTLLTNPDYERLWRDHIAQNLLNRIFAGLPEQACQLLCAFSVYREAVPIDAALPIATSITKPQALAILASLLGQHLIEPQSMNGSYRLHPIVATYAYDHFVENDEAANREAQQVAHAKAAQYYLPVATIRCPEPDKRKKISDVEPLIEAVWQFCQAGQFQEAYDLLERDGLADSLSLWSANTTLLELYRLFLSENRQYTPQQKDLIFNNLGYIYDSLGQKRQALEYYKKSLDISREVGDRGGEGISLNNVGGVYDNLGQKQQALEYYKQSLDIRREVGDRRGEGTTLNSLGRMYDNLGQKQQALEYYKQSLDIRREVGDRRGEGITLNNLGTVYNDLGQKEQALEYYEQALTTSQEVGDRAAEGTTFNNLGLLYNNLGQKQEALRYYEQALRIFGEVGDRGGEGTILNNLGLLYESLGQKQQALQYFRQVLAISQEVGDRAAEGTALNNIGGVYNALGQKQQALEYCKQALVIGQEVGSPFGEGVSLNNIGAIFNERGDDEPALACFLLARTLFERVQSPSDIDSVERWIEDLRKRLGEDRFATLLAQVEPRAEQIVQDALRSSEYL